MGECLESLGTDTLDAGESGMEVAGGSPPVDMDICVVPDVLQTAVSGTTVVSEKWMVEVLRPILTLAGVRMCYRQQYLCSSITIRSCSSLCAAMHCHSDCTASLHRSLQSADPRRLFMHAQNKRRGLALKVVPGSS